ncbi:MAG TPA: site-2 protease family protein [bacterium]|nr:site-2 protease family protein [bacterium]
MLNGVQAAIWQMQHDPAMFVIRFLLLVIAITFHEFGHAAVAVSCGDPTPQQDGRVTLNPLAHLDPIGTIGMLLYTFGWGRPVMVRPGYFRGRWDHVKVAAAGPFMNVVQALAYGLAARALIAANAPAPVGLQILYEGMLINVGLATFNLIPIGPLDGATILKGFLPLETAYRFEQFNRQYGMMVMMLMLFTGYVGVILGPVQHVFTTLLLGPAIS